jgi:hypothetical protein
MKNASKKLSKVGDEMTSIGNKMTIGVTLPIVAAGVASVKAASDLNESLNKVDVVFGSASESVLKFAKNAATGLGMSENSALQAAGTFGNLFTSMGLGQSKSAELSTSLTQLASDLASFNNISPDEALQKLQSGIVGEAEPLRSLGVNINDAAVKAKAMELGLGGANGALTDQEKILARYALIMDQTKNAQGDFARTSDGLANSTRTLKAQFEDTLASFGQALLPLATKLISALIPILDWFNALPDSAKNTIVTVLMVVAAIGPLLSALGQIISVGGSIVGLFGTGGALASIGPALAGIFSGFLPAVAAIAAFVTGTLIPAIGAFLAAAAPVIAVVAAIAAVAALAYFAWTNNWGGIRDFLQPIIDKIVAWFQTSIPAALSALQSVWTTVWNALVAVWNAFMTVITPLMQAFQAALSGDWYLFGQKLREAWDAAWKLIITIVSGAWTAIKTTVSNLITDAINAFRNTDWGEVGRNIIRGIANGITSAVLWVRDAAVNAAKAAYDAARGFLNINSPSRLFAGLGVSTMIGMANGINSTAAVPVSATTKAVSAVADAGYSSSRNSTGSENSGTVVQAPAIDIDYNRIAAAVRDALMTSGMAN